MWLNLCLQFNKSETSSCPDETAGSELGSRLHQLVLLPPVATRQTSMQPLILNPGLKPVLPMPLAPQRKNSCAKHNWFNKAQVNDSVEASVVLEAV